MIAIICLAAYILIGFKLRLIHIETEYIPQYDNELKAMKGRKENEK